MMATLHLYMSRIFSTVKQSSPKSLIATWKGSLKVLGRNEPRKTTLLESRDSTQGSDSSGVLESSPESGVAQTTLEHSGDFLDNHDTMGCLYGDCCLDLLLLESSWCYRWR